MQQGLATGAISKKKPAPARKGPARSSGRKKICEPTGPDSSEHPAEDVHESKSSSTEEYLPGNGHAATHACAKSPCVRGGSKANLTTDASAQFEGAGRALQVLISPIRERQNPRSSPRIQSASPQENALPEAAASNDKHLGRPGQAPSSQPGLKTQGPRLSGHASGQEGVRPAGRALAALRKPLAGDHATAAKAKLGVATQVPASLPAETIPSNQTGPRLKQRPLAGRFHVGPLAHEQGLAPPKVKAVSPAEAVKRKRGQLESDQPSAWQGTARGGTPIKTEDGEQATSPAEAAKRRCRHPANAAPACVTGHCPPAKAKAAGNKQTSASSPAETTSSKQQPQTKSAAANGWTLMAAAADLQPVKRGRGRPPKHRSSESLHQQQQQQPHLRQEKSQNQPQQPSSAEREQQQRPRRSGRQPNLKQEASHAQPQQQPADGVRQQQEQKRPQRAARSCPGRSSHAAQLPQSSSTGSASKQDVASPPGLHEQAASVKQAPAGKHVTAGKPQALSSSASKPPLPASGPSLGWVRHGPAGHSDQAHQMQPNRLSRPTRSVSLNALYASGHSSADTEPTSRRALGPKGTPRQPMQRRGSSRLNTASHASGTTSAADSEEARVQKRRKVADKAGASVMAGGKQQAQAQSAKPSKPRKPTQKEGLKPWFGDQPLNFEKYLAQIAATHAPPAPIADGKADSSHGPKVST